MDYRQESRAYQFTNVAFKESKIYYQIILQNRIKALKSSINLVILY